MINRIRFFQIMSVVLTVAFLVAPLQVRAQSSAPPTADDPASPSLAPWLDAHRLDAETLIAAAMADSAAWDRLAWLTDTFGPRFSGSANLERAIDWIMEEMIKDGLENVRGEPVMVPNWVRGDEKLVLLEPHEREIGVLGLGGSVGTGPGGVTAEVLVVGSYDELTARVDEAKGKIVLWNVPFTSYGATVNYRSNGAVRAAEVGAVASLVRSVGPFSMYTPHTGNSRYDDNVPRIPHAAVTVEDAMMMQRIQDRGHTIRLRLEMDAQWLPDAESRNVVGEIVGSQYPDEVIVMGGHIDSWDVGTGAMDDAGGCVVAWEALRLMKELGLQPKRTIRVVMWTNEENGLRGGNAYRDAHMDELDNHVLAMESDAGVFKPVGFGFTGSDAAFDLLTEIGRLLEPIESGKMTRGGGGADIGPIMREGVPGMGLNVEGSRYFWYHHTNADYVDKMDPDHVARATATMAVMAYVVADMEQRLPR
ncbi:MAG: M28 family metallopeptidase [Bacteroidota bacterium]|nr:M28 family metallopeptidase [Bacteroidota bacterium]